MLDIKKMAAEVETWDHRNRDKCTKEEYDGYVESVRELLAAYDAGEISSAQVYAIHMDVQDPLMNKRIGAVK